MIHPSSGADSTITYTGLEPIDMTGTTATDLVFNLPTVGGPTLNALLDDNGSSSRISGSTFETTTFADPSGSLTINRGFTGDKIQVNALPHFDAGLTIGSTGSEFNSVTFAGAVTLASGKNLSANASSTISLPNATSNLTTSGAGAISLTSLANISLGSGSSLTSGSGAIALSANQQGTPSSGNFIGINVSGGTITSTSGPVTLSGKGGNDAGGLQYGVHVQNGGVVGSGTSNTVLVTGTGGATAGDFNLGVDVDGTGSRITSGGGDVKVTGFGGGSAASAADYGVIAFGGGQITSGGTGKVTVQGTGGSTTGFVDVGVFVDSASGSSAITSNGGAVSVTGTGGGIGAGTQNYGVLVQNGGQISAGAGGTVTVTGTLGSGTGAFGIEIIASGAISTGSNATLNLIADSMDLSGSVSAGAGTVNLTEKTTGTLINLGAADVTAGPLPLTLGLTNSELGNITAGLLKIGDANSGSITVSAAISAPAGWNKLSLQTGAAIVDGNTVGADLTVTGLALRAVTGIGSSDSLDTAVSNLAVSNTTGGNVAVANTARSVVTSSAIDGLTGVANSGGGSVSLVAASPLTVNAPINAGTGAVNLTAAGNDQLLTISASVSGGADSTFTADKMAIGSAVNVGTANKLTLVPESIADSGDAINLGSVVDTTANTLELSSAEINNITAGTISIGDTNSGTITIGQPISRSSTNLNLTTGSNKNIAFNGSGSLSFSGGIVTLTTSGSGAISSTTGATIITVGGTGTISLKAASGNMGTSGSPLILSGANLDTTTSSNDNQFLSASSSITIDPTGLGAGTGTIELDAGTFKLGGSQRINDNTSLTLNGGTFDLNSFIETIGGLNGSSSGLVTNSTGTLGTLTVAGGGSFAGNVTGANTALTVGGATQTLTLSGNNTFGGLTTINAGDTLKAGSATALTSTTSVSDAGTLDLNGNSISVGPLSGTGIVLNNATATTPTLTVSVTTGTTAFGGTIQDHTAGTGTLAFTKSGAGNETLSATDTYTGTTTVSGGTLELTATGTIGNTTAVHVDGGTLQIDASQRINDAAPVTVGTTTTAGTLALQTFAETVAGVTLVNGSITGTLTGTLTGTSYNVQDGSVSAILAGAGVASRRMPQR